MQQYTLHRITAIVQVAKLLVYQIAAFVETSLCGEDKMRLVPRLSSHTVRPFTRKKKSEREVW